MLRPPAIFSYLVPRTQAIRLLPSRQRNEKRWTAQEKTTKETHVGGVLWSGVEKPKLTVEKHYKAFRASNQYFNQPPPLPKCLQTKQANSRTSRKPLLWHWETKTNRNKQVEGQWSCKEEKTSKNTKHIPTKSWVLPCWNKNSIILKKMHSKVKRMKHMNRRKEKLNKGVRWNIKLEKSSRK